MPLATELMVALREPRMVLVALREPRMVLVALLTTEVPAESQAAGVREGMIVLQETRVLVAFQWLVVQAHCK